MAGIGQLRYRVLDTGSGTYVSSDGLDEDQMFGQSANLVKFYDGSKQFNKLGIQAPPGTKAVINEKTIMVGRTGIYELDEDITITSLRFIRPKKYILDEDASRAAIENGTKAMTDANTKRTQKMAELNQRYPSPPYSDAYWEEYTSIQETYITEYEAGHDEYSLGKNGIYVLPDPSNVHPELNYENLYNVIIDFIYE